jgi:hypothetical protein
MLLLLWCLLISNYNLQRLLTPRVAEVELTSQYPVLFHRTTVIKNVQL